VSATALNPRQFEYIDVKGESHQVSSTDYGVGRISIEKIKGGMKVRPDWQSRTDIPFEETAGPSINEPETAHDPDTWNVTYPRKYGPHYPSGTKYHVLMTNQEMAPIREARRRVQRARMAAVR